MFPTASCILFLTPCWLFFLHTRYLWLFNLLLCYQRAYKLLLALWILCFTNRFGIILCCFMLKYIITSIFLLHSWALIFLFVGTFPHLANKYFPRWVCAIYHLLVCILVAPVRNLELCWGVETMMETVQVSSCRTPELQTNSQTNGTVGKATHNVCTC